MNEERFAKEMKKIQSVVSRALQKANTLTALADGGKMSREKLQLTLEETAYFFESATLHLRSLCETQMPGIGGYGRREGLEFQLPSGHIEIAGAGWVHMQIDTLLPHCRYMPATWLTDTVREIKIDYFAVSLPDLLIFEENLNERNRKHCLFMMSLGLRGLGQTDEAKACAEELLSMDNAHQGIRVHDL